MASVGSKQVQPRRGRRSVHKASKREARGKRVRVHVPPLQVVSRELALGGVSNLDRSVVDVADWPAGPDVFPGETRLSRMAGRTRPEDILGIRGCGTGLKHLRTSS